jgi:hypothetical protein
MSSFKLINPSIQGNVKNTVSAENSLDAAKQIWTNLSKYFTNDVPAFAFTIENQNGGALSHFKVEETKHKNEASFKIELVESKLKSSDMKKFKRRIDELPAMKGGKHHSKKDKDDSSSSSSSSEAFDALKMYKKFSKRNNSLSPIVYWWYDPSPYNLSSVYIPTFIAPVQPYIEVATVGYYLY